MTRRKGYAKSLRWAAVVAALLFVAICVVPVAASVWPSNNNTYVSVANSPVRFPSYSSTQYFFNLTNTSTDAGAKALHIASNNYTFTGDITSTTATTGTFYVSDTGGRGCQDDVILLVAVNKTSAEEDFALDITAKGYVWTPTEDGYLPSWEEFESLNQQTTLNNLQFDSTDFLEYSSEDVLQSWKFAPAQSYPVYNGQPTDNSKLFNLIAIDLKAGVIGNQYKDPSDGKKYPTYYANLTDFGMVNVTYSLTGIEDVDMVAFNVYAYNNQTAQGQGVNWYNKVTNASTSDSSGWRVVPT